MYVYIIIILLYMSVCLDQLLILSDTVVGIDWNKSMEYFVGVIEVHMYCIHYIVVAIL